MAVTLAVPVQIQPVSENQDELAYNNEQNSPIVLVAEVPESDDLEGAASAQFGYGGYGGYGNWW